MTVLKGKRFLNTQKRKELWRVKLNNFTEHDQQLPSSKGAMEKHFKWRNFLQHKLHLVDLSDTAKILFFSIFSKLDSLYRNNLAKAV